MKDKEYDYMNELATAAVDDIAAGIKGELVRIALLACGGVTSQWEREDVAILMLRRARALNIDSASVRACASELITRCDKENRQ